MAKLSANGAEKYRLTVKFHDPRFPTDVNHREYSIRVTKTGATRVMVKAGADIGGRGKIRWGNWRHAMRHGRNAQMAPETLAERLRDSWKLGDHRTQDVVVTITPPLPAEEANRG